LMTRLLVEANRPYIIPRRNNMLMKITTTILSGMLVLTTFGIQSIRAQTDKQTAKIRGKVFKYGLAKKVVVKLKDKSKFKGYISKIEKDTFTVTDKANKDTTFSYSEVNVVRKSGVPVGVWIGVGAAAAVGALVLIIYGCHARC